MISISFLLLAGGALCGSVVSRQSITTLTETQIDVFTPYTYYAAAAYCTSIQEQGWTCGLNCEQSNPDFAVTASGGGGPLEAPFWYVGYDSHLETVIVAHEGTNLSNMYVYCQALNFQLEAYSY